MVNFVPAHAYRFFYLALLTTFTQPEKHPCSPASPVGMYSTSREPRGVETAVAIKFPATGILGKPKLYVV